jgi:hypothetical protein
MGIDILAIKKKLMELETGKKASNSQMWKPEVGQYKVRVIPWPQQYLKEGLPFVERFFYYLGDNPGIVTLKQFGESDPIAELIHKLYTSGDADDKKIAKKLLPKPRNYCLILVEGELEKGLQIWSFGRLVNQRLLGFFCAEDTENWMSLEDGFDVEVKLTQIAGKQFPDTTVDLARRSSSVLKWFNGDADKMQKVLEAVPDIESVYRRKTYEEMQNLLNNWLIPEQRSTDAGVDSDVETTQKLDEDLKSLSENIETLEKTDSASKKKQTTKKKAAVDVDVDDFDKKLNESLDDLLDD